MGGERPMYPDGAQKLGFVEPIWSMTMNCWQHDPGRRPAMATVVGFLREWLVIPPPPNKPTYLLLAAMQHALRILLCSCHFHGSNLRTQDMYQLAL